MNPHDTIKNKLLGYPLLYQSKWQCLKHLFCCIGNGYKWINGELCPIWDGGETKLEDYTNFDSLTPYEIAWALTRKEHLEEIINGSVMMLVGYVGHYEVEPCVEYASFFHVPDDVTKEWLEVLIDFGQAWTMVLGYVNPKGQIEVKAQLERLKLKRGETPMGKLIKELENQVLSQNPCENSEVMK